MTKNIFEDYLDKVQATDIIEEPDNLSDELSNDTFDPTDYIDIELHVFYTMMKSSRNDILYTFRALERIISKCPFIEDYDLDFATGSSGHDLWWPKDGHEYSDFVERIDKIIRDYDDDAEEFESDTCEILYRIAYNLDQGQTTSFLEFCQWMQRIFNVGIRNNDQIAKETRMYLFKTNDGQIIKTRMIASNSTNATFYNMNYMNLVPGYRQIFNRDPDQRELNQFDKKFGQNNKLDVLQFIAWIRNGGAEAFRDKGWLLTTFGDHKDYDRDYVNYKYNYFIGITPLTDENRNPDAIIEFAKKYIVKQFTNRDMDRVGVRPLNQIPNEVHFIMLCDKQIINSPVFNECHYEDLHKDAATGHNICIHVDIYEKTGSQNTYQEVVGKMKYGMGEYKLNWLRQNLTEFINRKRY